MGAGLLGAVVGRRHPSGRPGLRPHTRLL